MISVKGTGGGKKEGLIVWKKLTAEGGDFVDFVVNDDSTKYPDGGMQDGYWYELVIEGFDLSRLGFSQIAIDTYVASYRKTIPAETIPHTLGTKPDFALIIASDGSQVVTTNDMYYSTFNNTAYKSSNGVALITSGLVIGYSTETSIQFINNSSVTNICFVAGLEYTVITGKY